MKHLLCVLLSCVSIEAALWMTDVYDLARKCIKMKEVNGTEDDVTDLLMGYLPNTKSGMCMLRCMEAHVGILVNDTYDVRGTYLFFRNTFPENPYVKNIERGVRFCGTIAAKRRTPSMDPCQYAHLVASCIKRRIRFNPGCRAAFYNPFKWKNPKKKATVKPGKKYFVPDPRFIRKVQFEVITKPTRKYTLDDLQVALSSSESVEPQANLWVEPKPRKGKWNKGRKEEAKKKKMKKDKAKKTDSSESDDLVSSDDVTDDDETLEKSSKTRRHQKKQFRI